MANEYRYRVLTIDKVVNGQQAAGYPLQYSITDAFTWNSVSYPALSSTDFSLLTDTDYQTRLFAFLQYLQVTEPGFSTTDIQNMPTGVDPLLCPTPTCIQVVGYYTTSGVTAEACAHWAANDSSNKIVLNVSAADWNTGTGLPVGAKFKSTADCDADLNPTSIAAADSNGQWIFAIQGIVYTVNASGEIIAKANC